MEEAAELILEVLGHGLADGKEGVWDWSLGSASLANEEEWLGWS